jgi:predicted nucleic acid-binding protein
MKYLLDVNALVALGFLEHSFHSRVAAWVADLAPHDRQLMTCPITELGFVRVLSQAQQYGFTVQHAWNLLLRLKKSDAVRFGFIDDNHDASHLPSWTKTARQTTDGHRAELARAHGTLLATLDERIPGAFVIPFWQT